jgi:hypothetical protein
MERKRELIEKLVERLGVEMITLTNPLLNKYMGLLLSMSEIDYYEVILRAAAHIVAYAMVCLEKAGVDENDLWRILIETIKKEKPNIENILNE